MRWDFSVGVSAFRELVWSWLFVEARPLGLFFFSSLPPERSRHPGAARLAAAVALIVSSATPVPAQGLGMPIDPIWSVPDVGALPDDAHGRLVRRGRDLITATYAHMGSGGLRSRQAVRRQQPGLPQLPPGSRNQTARVAALGFDRPVPALQSANGRADHHRAAREHLHGAQHERASDAASDAPEMQAIVAYIDFLSTGRACGREAARARGWAHA